MTNTPQHEDYQTENFKLYDMYRKEILEWQQSNTEAYDRAIFSVASVFFTASMVFVRFEGFGHTRAMQACLAITWLSLVLAIACTLSSFVFGNCALGRQLQQLERAYLNGDHDAIKEKNPFEKCRKFASSLAMLFLIAATVSFVSFALIVMLH